MEKQAEKKRESSQIEKDIKELRDLSSVLGVIQEKVDEGADRVIDTVRARLLKMSERFDRLFDQGLDQVDQETCVHPVLVLRGISKGVPLYRCATGACNIQLWLRNPDLVTVERIVDAVRGFNRSDEEEFVQLTAERGFGVDGEKDG